MYGEETKARLREFFSRHGGQPDLTDEADIFDLGLLNSLILMELVLFIEREFNVAVADEDLDDDNNFRTIRAIVALLNRKTTAPAPV